MAPSDFKQKRQQSFPSGCALLTSTASAVPGASPLSRLSRLRCQSHVQYIKDVLQPEAEAASDDRKDSWGRGQGPMSPRR